jgi:hypothetical protein
VPDPNARLAFWRHRRSYLALKMTGLIVAAALALRIAAWLVAA